MLDTYEKLRIVNTDNREIFTVEVNWEDKPETNMCKILKLNLPDGKTEFIKRETLLAFLWAIGSSAEHQKMIPIQLQKTRVYETVVGIVAKKDIRKGEMINTAIKIQLPSVHDEVIGELKKKKFPFISNFLKGRASL